MFPSEEGWLAYRRLEARWHLDRAKSTAALVAKFAVLLICVLLLLYLLACLGVFGDLRGGRTTQ